MKKKFTLAGIGLVFTFLAIVLSIFLYAKTDHAKNLLVNKINTSIPGTILVENLEFSLTNSYVKLDGIQLKDIQNTTCFKFKSLFVDFKISSLVNKVLEITLLTVNRPEILLVKDTSGHINLMDTLIPKDKNSPEKEITKKENKGLPFNVVVKKVQVIDGALTFNDPDNSIELRSLNIDINDINLFAQTLSLTSQVKNSTIRLKDKQILIENFSIVSELEQGAKIHFDIELDSDLCVFKAKGIGTNILKDPQMDFNLTATSNLEQFNRFYGGNIDPGGLAKVTLKGKGPVNNPEVLFNLDVSRLIFDEDLKGEKLALSATLDDRIISIKKANLDTLGSDIAFKGMVDLKELFPKGFLSPARNSDFLKYDFSFDQKNGDFQHIEKWVKGFSGRFSSAGKLTGKGIHPETLAASYQFNLVLEDFKQDKPETDFLDFETDIIGTLEKGICKITGFKAKTDDSTIEAFGQYDIFKKTLNADLNAKSQDLYSITLPLGILPVKGSFDSKINIAGHIHNPEIKAQVSGKNLMAQGIWVNDLKFEGSLNPEGLVQIQQLAVKEQDQVLEVKGSARVFEKLFKLKDVIKADIILSGQNINPERFFEHADIKINHEQLDSLINSNLNINANLNMVVDYTIDASMDKTNFYDIEIPVKNIKADLDLEKSEIAIKLEKIASLNASMDTEKNQYQARINFGHSDLSPFLKSAGIKGIKANINGQINATGNIPVDLPEDIVKGLHAARGNISLNADIDGSFKEPDFDADITLSGLGYPIPQAGISISNLNGKIKIADDLIQIQNITADLDKGSLSLDGKIDLKDYTPVKGEIKFKGNNITLDLADMALIEFNHDLRFSGTREKSILSGRFMMIKGKYYKDFTFDLADALKEKKRKTSLQEDKNNVKAPWLENIALNIDVDYKEPFAVDNNIAFILVEPNVKISGTAANPVITGRTRIIEGIVIYHKKEFQIEKGIIDFADPYKIDPDIDLAAKTIIRDWTITLKISGKTDNLKFQLFSEPAESHEDILSLLIAGKTTKEKGGSTKGSYTNILTDKAADIIGKSVEESTPLDSFKLGYSGAEGSNVSVTLGKKLSKRLEVTYSMETEDQETVHTNAAEYKLLENVMLKAFNDSKGDFGTEVILKLEFR